MAKLTVDGVAYTVQDGRTVLQALDDLGVLMNGVDVPHYCWHPKLSIDGSCRLCQVEIEGFPKLQIACNTPVKDGMVVRTDTERVRRAREGVMELLLVNHPLDCPICDKAGECKLQDYAYEYGLGHARTREPRRALKKRAELGPTIVLDQERCILCSRCIRTCDEVAGQHQLEFAHRGDHEVLTTAPGEQLDNPYSLNTVDVCPVGALTAKDFRFTMRAWELEATPSICNGCGTGCNIEIHHKHGRAWRLVPRHNPDVNKYWMCDEGRFTYHALREERLASATVEGLPAGWDRAIATAAKRLAGFIKDPAQLGVVLSAQHSNEDNFALASLAKQWGIKQVYLAGRPPVPARADGKLRVADVNPNTTGAKAIAEALGLGVVSAFELDANAASALRALVILGDTFTGMSEGRMREADVIAISAYERGPVPHAKVALPAAAWAETAGTITNVQGRVQRMHAAFGPPGNAIPGWEAVVRLAHATGNKLAWTHAREVFKDMTAAVPAWKELTWAREARPLQLRFAGSRG
jgi:NADH-quinone oxidoreductase subunit G